MVLLAAAIVRAREVERIFPDPVIDFPRRCIIRNGKLIDDRRLIVSNSPETIRDLTRPVLWHDEVAGKSGQTIERHRIFLWHADGFSERGIKVG